MIIFLSTQRGSYDPLVTKSRCYDYFLIVDVIHVQCTDRYEEFIRKILNGFNGWVIMIKVLDLK